ncbi:sensory box histidine kinase/response regulator [Fimbriiglobus ruber]|uniref:Sensory box histidine kinase/response regulator n=1 Tax=Fimbriiglobus ruber TaxID=1908690 RepID=A0A225DVS2_9BACT|nr:sensory box histidine kinase/response regulator [Fimbriiglobus ruber]
MILVVDDERMIRTLITRALQTRGYTVLDACNGHEALALARGYKGTIHLTITDVRMPGLPADEFVAQLRGDRPMVRVIYISGQFSSADLSSGLPGQQAAILPKPFSPTTLTTRVREILDAEE